MESPSIILPKKSEGMESIKVLVRVRPLSVTELAEKNDSVVDIISDQSLNVTSADGKKSFKCSFDSVLGPESTQNEVYDIIRGCTESVIDGFNSTIFAYGQTGSGKTYSMYGPPSTQPNTNTTTGTKHPPRGSEHMGLIPRAIEEIFELVHNRDISDFQVHCSFVQIYNENLYDMLRDASMNTPLTIREDKKEIYVQGLSEYNVKSVQDTMQLLKIAEENRAIRETNMNLFSSRSHSIFQIQCEHKKISIEDGCEITYKAKFNLVDLAGSEKWNTKLYMRDEHIAEMTNINLSLHTLGKCISALAQNSIKQNRMNITGNMKDSTTSSSNTGSSIINERLDSRDWDARSLGSLDHSGSTIGSIKDITSTKQGRYSHSSSSNRGDTNNNTTSNSNNTHIPFRESKLTRLLQDSLGGNAKTFLIATVSPARANSEESISTLKFADRAKQVMVQAIVNESRPVDYALVKRLQQEVEMLKALVKRLVQAQNIGNSMINMKLKQANTVADLNTLVNNTDISSIITTTNNSSSNTSSNSTKHNVVYKNGKIDSPFPGGSPGRVYSPEPDRTQLTGNNNSEQTTTPLSNHHNNANNTGNTNSTAHNSLEYVISLEKALNQEQIHSQHLSKKNETLIKELEGLKFQNIQLVHNNQHLYGSGGSAKEGVNTPHPLSKSISVNNLNITKGQVEQVTQSIQGLVSENRRLLEQTESIQKTMKKFFKFQIEEEDMKKSCEQVFAVLKEIKSASASNTVVDNFAFLEFLASNANNTSTVPTTIATDQSNNVYTPGGVSTSPSKQTKKQLRHSQEASTAEHTSYVHPHSNNINNNNSNIILQKQYNTHNNSNIATTIAGMPIRENKKTHAYIAQKELNQQRSLPSLHSNSNTNTTTATTNTTAKTPTHLSPEGNSRTVQTSQRYLTSAGSDQEGDEEYIPPYTPVNSSTLQYQQAQYIQQLQQQQPLQQQYQQPLQYYQQEQQPMQYQQQQQLQQQQQRHTPQQSSSLLYPQASNTQPLQGLTFRVRGGSNTALGPLSNGSANSLASSGGWVMPAEEDAAAAEAALKAELKQAKRKLKKQAQRAEWQRIKDEKMRADIEAEEAQKAAEAEAEALKEQKRKEYAQKQKQKLAQYQNKVKSEAEKIQELKNLGIDPSSLF